MDTRGAPADEHNAQQQRPSQPRSKRPTCGRGAQVQPLRRERANTVGVRSGRHADTCREAEQDDQSPVCLLNNPHANSDDEGVARGGGRVGLRERRCCRCALRPVARKCNYRFPRRSARTLLVPDEIGRA